MPVGILRSLSALSLMFCIGSIPRTAPLADSSSPMLAAYYDRQMAIVDGVAYGWAGENPPKRIASGAEQVGVGRQFYYVLDGGGVLRRFGDAARPPKILRADVASFAAGRSGVLAIGKDRALWWIRSNDGNARLIAKDIAAAAVGDSANYYVTHAGALFVKGLAHRGQYGDGKLTETDRFVSTASGVARVFAHTGHALVLMKNGDVLGTGGNIYGPVGRHGLGDKAVRWSRIVSGVSAVATGSSHSLAILPDGRLIAWGAGYGPDPVAVMEGVAAVAAGSSSTVVLKIDGSLWQWDRAGQNRRNLRLP